MALASEDAWGQGQPIGCSEAVIILMQDISTHMAARFSVCIRTDAVLSSNTCRLALDGLCVIKYNIAQKAL